MVEKLADQWPRDLEVLVAAARQLEANVGRTVSDQQLFGLVKMSQLDVARAAIALHQSGYLEVNLHRGAGGGPPRFHVTGLTERGRRASGLLPSGETVDALVDALRQAEQEVDDPEDKSLLRKAASALVGISRDVTTDVLAAVIKSQTGL